LDDNWFSGMVSQQPHGLPVEGMMSMVHALEDLFGEHLLLSACVVCVLGLGVTWILYGQINKLHEKQC